MTSAQERHNVIYLQPFRGVLTHVVDRDSGVALCGHSGVWRFGSKPAFTCPRCSSRLATLDKRAAGGAR